MRAGARCLRRPTVGFEWVKVPEGGGRVERVRTRMGEEEGRDGRWAALRLGRLRRGKGARQGRALGGAPLRILRHEAEGLEYSHGGAGLIEAIEMNAGCALAEEFVDLAGGVLDAELGDGFIVVAEGVELSEEGRGEFGAAEFGKFAGLSAGEDGEDSWDEGDMDAEIFGEKISEHKVVRIVEEELGDDEVCAGLDFVAEVGPVDEFASGAGDVAFWESSGADAESVVGVEEGDELGGELEAADCFYEGARAARGVAAEREDVFDIAGAGFLDDVGELVAGGVDASEVHHRGAVPLALNAVDDSDGFFPGAAASAIGDGAIVEGGGLE